MKPTQSHKHRLPFLAGNVGRDEPPQASDSAAPPPAGAEPPDIAAGQLPQPGEKPPLRPFYTVITLTAVCLAVPLWLPAIACRTVLVGLRLTPGRPSYDLACFVLEFLQTAVLLGLLVVWLRAG